MGVYTNGRPERVTSSVAGPLSGVSPDLFFLGRSLFAADAWLQARIDEFRIYHCRLTEEEIATSFAAGPNHLAVPANLSATSSRSGLSLGWPAYAVGFVPEAAVALEEGAIWTRIPDLPLIDNGRHSLTVPIEGGSQFFRLRLDTQEQQHENLATRL